MFDFLQEDNAQSTYEQYLSVYNAMPGKNGHKKSLVPHAPYSVSKNLFQLINDHLISGSTNSIHNQELHAENELFQNKAGGFIDFYDEFNISLEHFDATHTHSILYTISHLSPKTKTLMVHNTVSVEDDIIAAHQWNPATYWVTCPNANLYIENKLPYYQYFINQEAMMCIGTDSLTSNWQLDMLSEMKTIKRYQSYIDDIEILKWATINGAEALGYDEYGKIFVGSSPGLVHLEGSTENGEFKLADIEKSYRII
jgi:cytosine/adenosine deaminase-related metal-dependent hydrolase